MTFDPTKPVQTRDGRKARIICTDCRQETGYPLIALVVSRHDGQEEILTYRDDGKYLDDNEDTLDLVNVPERHKHADVIIAWANGAKVQSRQFEHERWVDCRMPVFLTDSHYRVKPEFAAQVAEEEGI